MFASRVTLGCHVQRFINNHSSDIRIMGRKDNSNGHTNIDKYRKQLGKQEFKGRSKKHTLAEKTRAQSRKSDHTLLQTILFYIMVILAFVLAIYAMFYAMLQKPPEVKL